MARSSAFMSATILRYQHGLQSSISRQEVKNLLLVQPDGLVGREREIASACALLRRPDVRLITISGPGGVGKTRLAVHVSSLLATNFPGGVRCISLASISDPTLLIPVIAQELGFMESGEELLSTRIEGYLRDNPLLLLLDNFEQVLAASSILTDLLSACPGLKILVTSREVLHIRIEHELIVPPLALPDLKLLPDSEQLLHYAAIALFIQRAQVVKPGFQLTPTNAHTIAEICTRLDGLPLAIELAAARIKLLPPHMLLARLESRLRILISGPRDLPMRQQTLRNTLTWSYDLLNPKEQALFRCLSVFVHGSTLEAVENICVAFDDGIVHVLEIITSLVDKNLLHQVETADGGMRLLMLETVREYGLECLKLQGEADTVFKAHALYYLQLAEKAEPEIRKGQQVVWLDDLEQEYDNLRTALHWSLEHKEIELTLRFCGALCAFWLIRNYQKEGYDLVEKALGTSESDEVPVGIRAKAFYVAGVLAERQGQHLRSLACLQKSLVLYQSLNEQQGIASVLNKLGNALLRESSFEAHSLYERSLALARKQKDTFTIIDVLLSLADESVSSGDFTRAREIFAESLEYSKIVEDKRSIAMCLEGLGQITNREGNYGEAQTLLKESLCLYREIGDRVGIAFTLIPLGTAILYQGDTQTAQRVLEESLTVSKELGNRNKIANYLGNLGEVALSEKGENASAPRTLLEESLAIFRETGNEQGIASKLFALGCMECVQGTFAAALHFLEESLALFKRLNNRVLIAGSLNMLGHVYAHQGEYKTARTYMEQSLAITREIEDYRFLPSRLSHLGLVILNEGICSEVHPLVEESLAFAKRMEDRRSLADALGVAGLLYMYEKSYALAQAYFDESLALAREVGDRYLIGYRAADSGLLALHQRNSTKARLLIEESLATSIEIGNRWFIASCLERMGEVAGEQQQFLWATQLWGAAAALRDTIGAPIPPIEQEIYDDAVAAARVQLGEASFLSAWRDGYIMKPEQIMSGPVGKSLFNDIHPSELERTPPVSLQVSTGRSLPAQPFASLSTLKALTRREVEVLQLLVQGASNRDIADQLVLSEGTVKKHVSNICSKLCVQSRTQVVAKVLSLTKADAVAPEDVQK